MGGICPTKEPSVFGKYIAVALQRDLARSRDRRQVLGNTLWPSRETTEVRGGGEDNGGHGSGGRIEGRSGAPWWRQVIRMVGSGVEGPRWHRAGVIVSKRRQAVPARARRTAGDKSIGSSWRDQQLTHGLLRCSFTYSKLAQFFYQWIFSYIHHI